MIEVNLYAIGAQDPKSMVGRCVARSRFDKENMGVGVMEFVKGFLANNLSNFENTVGNTELSDFINSDEIMGTRDLSSINYFLTQAGYIVQIQNVADDEENPTGVVSGEIVEWNIIDRNFMQHDYPTATKIIPSPDMDISSVLKQVIDQSGLFDPNKFGSLKNPFIELVENMEKMKATVGTISPAVTSKIYTLLDEMGINIFCATSEN